MSWLFFSGFFPGFFFLAFFLYGKRRVSWHFLYGKRRVSWHFYTPERRITILQPLLQVNQGRQAVISVMAAYPAPAYNPDLITLFRDNPTDPAPLTALCVKDQADIIKFLIEVVRDGAHAAKTAAADQLGKHGDQAALFALKKLRNNHRGRTRAALNAAYQSLRQQLGPQLEVGAISPVQPGAIEGGLSVAATEVGTLAPSDKPAQHDSTEAPS